MQYALYNYYCTVRHQCNSKQTSTPVVKPQSCINSLHKYTAAVARQWLISFQSWNTAIFGIEDGTLQLPKIKTITKALNPWSVVQCLFKVSSQNCQNLIQMAIDYVLYLGNKLFFWLDTVD